MSFEEPQGLESKLISEFNLRVIKPEKVFEMPEHLNFDSLQELGIDEEQAKDLAESIINFRNLPVLIDQFNQDHASRREWRSQVEAKYGEDALAFLKKNKLRVNSFTFINFFFATIDLHARKHNIPEVLSSKINSIREKYGEIVKGYPEMNVEEKIVVVGKLDELFEEVLDLLKA